MSASTKQRIAYIDWMRGLACLLMFQTHCYDSWLSPAARQSHFFRWSQLIGTLPAPLFLFLAGISFALGYPWSPWTDLLRVDILNTIGFSMMLMGISCRLARRRATNGMLAGAVALGVALFTPPLWTTWAPGWLPWFVETYVNGVHNLGKPQPWLFPIFPWAGFAFAGLAAGFLLMSDWARERQARTMLLLGVAGAILFGAGLWIDARLPQMYRVYDFWHTSPNF